MPYFGKKQKARVWISSKSVPLHHEDLHNEYIVGGDPSTRRIVLSVAGVEGEHFTLNLAQVGYPKGATVISQTNLCKVPEERSFLKSKPSNDEASEHWYITSHRWKFSDKLRAIYFIISASADGKDQLNPDGMIRIQYYLWSHPKEDWEWLHSLNLKMPDHLDVERLLASNKVKVDPAKILLAQRQEFTARPVTLFPEPKPKHSLKELTEKLKELTMAEAVSQPEDNGEEEDEEDLGAFAELGAMMKLIDLNAPRQHAERMETERLEPEPDPLNNQASATVAAGPSISRSSVSQEGSVAKRLKDPQPETRTGDTRVGVLVHGQDHTQSSVEQERRAPVTETELQPQPASGSDSDDSVQIISVKRARSEKKRALLESDSESDGNRDFVPDEEVDKVLDEPGDDSNPVYSNGTGNRMMLRANVRGVFKFKPIRVEDLPPLPPIPDRVYSAYELQPNAIKFKPPIRECAFQRKLRKEAEKEEMRRREEEGDEAYEENIKRERKLKYVKKKTKDNDGSIPWDAPPKRMMYTYSGSRPDNFHKYDLYWKQKEDDYRAMGWTDFTSEKRL